MSKSAINAFVKSNEKALFKFGVLAFMLWYALAAVLFYKERVFYSDSGAQMFEMLLNSDFKIYVGRYSMVINQLLPYLFIKAQASVKIVALAYSLSTPIITALALFFCYFKWNNKAATLAIMVSAACTSQTFFHSISETMLLIPYTAVFYAYTARILEQATRTWYQYAISCLFIVVAFFIHPVGLFTLSFVIVHLLLQSPKNNIRKLIPSIVVLCVLFLGKMFVMKYFTDVSHDKGFITSLLESLTDVQSLSSFPILGSFFKTIVPLLWSAIILLILAFRQYKKSGQKLKFRIEGLFVLGFFILTILIYKSGDAQVGMERAFLPFAFFAGIMSSVLFNSSIKKSHWLAVIPLLCLLLNAKGILISGHHYHKRVVMLEEKISYAQSLPAQKFYTPLLKEERKLLNADWALSVETLLLSSVGEGEQRTIFISPEFINPKLVYDNEAAIPFTPFWDMFYEDQLRESGYFEISGKLYPLVQLNKQISFSGLVLPTGVYASTDKEVLTKSQDNWQEIEGEKILSVATDNPYQNVVELLVPALTKISFSAIASQGGSVVLDSKSVEKKYFKSENSSEGWQHVLVEHTTGDQPEEIVLYAHSATDTLVNFKDIRLTLHASK